MAGLASSNTVHRCSPKQRWTVRTQQRTQPGNMPKLRGGGASARMVEVTSVSKVTSMLT